MNFPTNCRRSVFTAGCTPSASLSTLPACRARFFGRKFMGSSLLVRRFATLACYFALLGFIHGSKASFALAAASVIAISASIRNHDAPPV